MINDGLGPLPASPGPATPLSAPRAALLDRLRSRGAPCTVEDLAQETGQHHNTVREHLEALVGAGLADRTGGPLLGEGRPGRRGRPAKHYRASEPASGEAGYAGLAGALAAGLARVAPDPEAAGIDAGRRWARQAARRPSEPVSAAEARRRVLAELEDLGFGIEAGPRGEATVRLVSCPLLAAAREEPGIVCSVHAGLVAESLRLLGHPRLESRLEPFAGPGACLLTIGQP